MRRVIFISVFVVSLPTFAVAQSSQDVVTLQSEGQDFVGTLLLPGGDPAPVVLLLHGFTGSRDELTIPSTDQGVFVHTANSLMSNGYASLRIDFRGSGESTSDFTYESTTFEGQIADAMAAVAYLKASDKVNGNDISVIGWSQGGLVASAVAGRSGDLDAVALWQAVGDADSTYGSLLSTETLNAGKAAAPDQTITATLPWGADVSLNGAFFDGIETLDPMAEIAAYPGPLFVSQGLADTTVMPEVSTAFIAAHDGPEQLWTVEMDHVFNVFAETETLESLIDATVEFFRTN